MSFSTEMSRFSKRLEYFVWTGDSQEEEEEEVEDVDEKLKEVKKKAETLV